MFSTCLHFVFYPIVLHFSLPCMLLEHLCSATISPLEILRFKVVNVAEKGIDWEGDFISLFFLFMVIYFLWWGWSVSLFFYQKSLKTSWVGFAWLATWCKTPFGSLLECACYTNKGEDFVTHGYLATLESRSERFPCLFISIGLYSFLCVFRYIPWIINRFFLDAFFFFSVSYDMRRGVSLHVNKV